MYSSPIEFLLEYSGIISLVCALFLAFLMSELEIKTDTQYKQCGYYERYISTSLIDLEDKMSLVIKNLEDIKDAEFTIHPNIDLITDSSDRIESLEIKMEQAKKNIDALKSSNIIKRGRI